jgi:uncharacterized delta-60 repeat protein
LHIINKNVLKEKIMNGLVTTDFSGGYDFGMSLTTQSDGKIIVVGGGLKERNAEFLLVRYNTDGTLDTSFSGDGKLITDFGVNIVVAGSVIVQSDRKILVAGQIFDGVSTFSLALARYNVDGSLDTTFGGGDGKVTGAVCASQVTVQSDGKILVVGTTTDNIALARYNSDGSVDTTFGGGDGLVTVNPGGGGKGEGVIVRSDGKILVSGWNGTNTDFVLTRFTANGIFDNIVTTDFSNGDDRGRCIVQSNGKIIVAGFSLSGTNNNFALVRYNTDGSLDTSFSGDGKLISDLGGIDQGYSMVAQSDGKILVAGHSDNSIALVRYNIDGSLDSTFSNDGIVITAVGSLLATNEKSEILVGMGITLQADGKILVTGQSNGDLALIRYNIDGSVDTSFGVHDVTAPIVNAFNPADGGINVAVDHNVVVDFNESIQKGVGTIALHIGSAIGTVAETYNVATSSNVTISGATLTINPTVNLLSNTHYYVTFSSGSVKDLAGNSYAGTTSYDFTTTDSDLAPMVRNGVNVIPTRYSGTATAAGGVPINYEYIGDSTGEVLIGTQYNDFINVAGGVDAVNAGAGNDVIDGGTDSNFLTGGTGTDIFFSDGRGGVTTWSTITDWQAGEQLSVWGWTPGTSRIVEWVKAGAAGYEGLTMHADLNNDGTIDTSVTFTGIVSQSQLPTPLEFDGVLWFT